MAMITKMCANCTQAFSLTDEDQALLQKLEVPSPTLCPDCRQQRRLAWRNERYLYRRKCDFSGKEILSMYPPDSPFKVYDQDVWWSDCWDATQYGRDFDFSRPFFEQFRELQLAVPRVALVNKQSENSEYTNHSGKNKNCFMSAVVFGCEDVYYSDWIIDHCRDIADCSYLLEGCELCYETYYAWGCYRAVFCDLVKRCSELWFGYDCVNVKNSFLCWNLRNKEYHIRNKPYSKEDYETEMKKIFPLTHEKLQALRAEYIDIKNRVAYRPAIYEVNSENSTGDLLFESKNVYYGFDSIRVEDCRTIFDAIDVKDSMDLYHVGWAELMYECHAISNAYGCRFCHFTYDNTNATYCDCTQNCKNVFGCAGLNRREYCILNKQYTKEEYEEMVPRIIEHMKQPIASKARSGFADPSAGLGGIGGAERRTGPQLTKEYGEFFPIQFSPFAYNQSRAQEYSPLTKESAEKKGIRWSDYQVPMPSGENLEKCEVTGRPFKLIKPELDFYKKMGLPPPRRHPDQRYLDRMAQRNPRTLFKGFKRTCVECSQEILSSFKPDSHARVLCRSCYLTHIY